MNLNNIRQCKKQTTVAIIMKDGELISIGTNEIHADITTCPREGLKTGEGYHLCKTICKQERHAEADACFKAGDRARGGTLILIGHTYCCDSCKKIMDEHGIVEIKIVNKY